jgi:hypothetical protein
MQPREEPASAPDRSRRKPPRGRSEHPIPIPEARSRPRRTRTVKLQEVLKAYQLAVVDVLEQRIAAASEAAAESARLAVAEALAERPPGGPEAGDVTKGVLAYTDERFQAMSLRLQHIEEALRRLATAPPPTGAAVAHPDERVLRRLDAIGRAVARLAEDHRGLADELGRRTGKGVVAVGKVVREDLASLSRGLGVLREGMTGLGDSMAGMGEGMEGVQTSVRSMHRTMAWEGMRTPRPRPGSTGPT